MNHHCHGDSCDHKVAYCRHCGTVYCEKCGKEWFERTTSSWSYTTVPLTRTYTAGNIGALTVGTEVSPLAMGCDHK
jgi:hypothetical protein